MLLALIVALSIGILVGTITGLTPGIHNNLVSVLVLAWLPAITTVEPLTVAVFIVALAITHTLTDFIPSIYLGAPEEDTFLAVLPGHELLKEGKGHEAVTLALYGSLAAIPVILIAIPFFMYFGTAMETKIIPFLPFLLIFVVMYMILREENILSALIVFLLAGFIGFATFNLPVREPLLPLLTGLFGVSGILLSLKSKSFIPKQQITSLREIKLKKKDLRNAFLGSLLIAPVCSFLPAIGSGYAALISSELFAQSRKGFLFLVGSLNTIVMILSFVIIYSIGKSRTGAAAALEKLLQNISTSDLTIILIASLITIIMSFLITHAISRVCAKVISKVNYRKVSFVVLVVLIGVTIFFSNLLGLLVLIAGASLGIFAITSNIKRIHLMGSLLIPTILYYLF